MHIDFEEILENDTIKSIACVIVCVALGFGINKFISSPASALDKQIAAVNSDIAKINNQLTALSSSNIKDQQEAVSSVSGADLSRVNDDSAYIKKFLTDAFTWSTYEEYKNARESVASTYKIPLESDFFKNFVPDIPNTLNGGVYINLIDTTGLNLAYDNAKITLVSVSDNVYTYMVECSVVSKDNVSSTSNSESVALMLSIPVARDKVGVNYVSKVEI